MNTKISTTLWKPDGTKFHFEISSNGEGAIYEFGTGKAKGSHVQDVTLDPMIDINAYFDEQRWPHVRRISSSVYNGGQCLAQLLP